MDSNDDDLYGDLDLTIDKKESKVGGTEHNNIHKKRTTGGGNERGDPPIPPLPRHRYDLLSNHHKSASPFESSNIRGENESLKKTIKILQDENLLLKRNIGTLFRTAKNEIKRKDDHIERLQRQQDDRN